MVDVPDLIRTARSERGMTQRDLAERLNTTQSAVARLEGRGGSPTVKTLDRVMAALGKNLVVEAVDHQPLVDETLIASNLRLSPDQRLSTFTGSYRNMRSLLADARRG